MKVDAYIECSFDNLLDMASGKVSADSLFLSDQLKISGNLARGYDIRHILAPISEIGRRFNKIRKKVDAMDSEGEKKPESSGEEQAEESGE